MSDFSTRTICPYVAHDILMHTHNPSIIIKLLFLYSAHYWSDVILSHIAGQHSMFVILACMDLPVKFGAQEE
jgi:hypothetical protein